MSRPWWRIVAGRARRGVYRLATPVERIILRRPNTLLPPAHLRKYYYGTWDPARFELACQQVRTELMIRGLNPAQRVLEIGSGIGNLAIGLLDFLHGGYDGLEVHREAVAWCQREITPRHPAFRFHRADVANPAYNQNGRIRASQYCFPFVDRTFDVVFAASVFTHMMPDETEHYLREIARVLIPGGLCLTSYFLLNDESLAGVNAGASFMRFDVRHSSGLCRLHDASMPASAVAIDEAFIRQAHAGAGLDIGDVHRGGWWKGEAHHQDIMTAARILAGAVRHEDERADAGGRAAADHFATAPLPAAPND